MAPASDGAGEIVEVGERVSRRRVGDRVAAAFFPTWIDGELEEAHHASALGGTLDGVLREELVVDERAAVSLPDHLSFEEGATRSSTACSASTRRPPRTSTSRAARNSARSSSGWGSAAEPHPDAFG